MCLSKSLLNANIISASTTTACNVFLVPIAFCVLKKTPANLNFKHCPSHLWYLIFLPWGKGSDLPPPILCFSWLYHDAPVTTISAPNNALFKIYPPGTLCCSCSPSSSKPFIDQRLHFDSLATIESWALQTGCSAGAWVPFTHCWGCRAEKVRFYLYFSTCTNPVDLSWTYLRLNIKKLLQSHWIID